MQTEPAYGLKYERVNCENVQKVDRIINLLSHTPTHTIHEYLTGEIDQGRQITCKLLASRDDDMK